MFDDLPEDLPRLETLRVWHTLWLARIDAKIAAVQQRQAEVERGLRRRPERPEWTVELGIGAGRPPVQVHSGDCHMTGERRRPVGRDEARRLLADGLRPCAHCRPDTQLDIIDLPCGAFPALLCPWCTTSALKGRRPTDRLAGTLA
ncbi:hypothetical protein J2X68_002711 [Streptomyces sp. 3330]|uniref:DUF6233 domain-containing protein n=1 Tax=Streptomyces sp. 3330 TaxID=2817755 RepID=UPI00285FD46A|nr:DUF6233 domain-containing protein [Streptomyces sp. 3330]MDR6976023.1 hypothetical protein [Streptomyces sp. 3330]